jgi:hypothetical protein
MTSKEEPHWNFEAFRNFISFEVLQQACAALTHHEGITISEADVQLRHLNNQLLKRTGFEWTPDRSPGGNINWETEGSLFRNKKRVFTSFYLLDIREYELNNRLVLTPLGRALAEGKIMKDDFYSQIVQRFKYPHEAYEDNWNWWKQEGRELRPLLFILLVLAELSKIDDEFESVSVMELACFGGPNPATSQYKQVASAISRHRKSNARVKHTRRDAHDRKISDMFGFLAMTQFAALKGANLALNPVRRATDGYCWTIISPQEVNRELSELSAVSL